VGANAGVYADGLNRYYLAREHGDLAEAFKYPPNVFDGFVRSDQVLLEGSLQKAQEQLHQSQEHWCQSQEQLHRLQEHWSQSQEQLHQLREQLHQSQEQFRAAQESRAALQAENAQMRDLAARMQEVEDALAHASGQHAQVATQLAAVYASNSWRITAPLRKLSILVSSASLRGKILTKVLLRYAAVRIDRYPQVKRVMLMVLNRLPALKGRLARILVQQTSILPVLRKDAEGGLLANPSVLPSAPSIPEAMLLPEVASSTRRWVRLVGHVEGHYSLAIVNRGLAGALEQVTRKLVSFVPYHGTPYTEVPNLPPDQDEVLHQALRRSIPAEAVDDAISIVHHYPFINDDLPAGQRGMVFFWEETSVPEGIVNHINAFFDLVWVAAESVKRALINSGCSVPIFVIPIGIDHLVSDDVQPLGDLRVTEGQRFRFLHVSSVFERKGVDVLLTSYLKAFTADDDVELYIKTFPNPHNQIGAQLKEISAEFERPARVVIDENPLDDEGLLALYRTAHAMVLPTRGEGFNLPAAEALAMALPVITTGYGAQVDFCTRATSTLVNFHFAPSRSHVRSSDSCWMEPDAADLTAKLRILHKRVLAEDPELNAQRQVALNHVRSTYRWENSARSLLASAGWLADCKPVNKFESLHLALVSPWATRCGIAEYSHKLLVAVNDNPGVQLNVYCDDRTDSAPANALVSWRVGANDTVPEVLDRIAKTDAQVVLVQHQPSLFPLSEICCQRLAALHDQGRVVVLELHSTLPLLEECRVTAAAVKLLAKLDRIIVHKPEDLNHMLALGLADNVMLLHHGVIQPLDEPHEQGARAELGIPGDALVLGCFGFALPHKGIDTLVEVIEPLSKAVGRAVHLVALNSILDERSEQIILHCQERARQLGVNDKISWITDYRSIETCQRLLGAADYIVFPYRDTRESASGAVTIGLSTLKPVLVSPLEIFSDLADVTWKMEGNGAADVLRAVQSLHAQSQLTTDLIERQRAWLQARDWSKLSTRLLTLMATLRRERQLADVVAPARHDCGRKISGNSCWSMCRRSTIAMPEQGFNVWSEMCSLNCSGPRRTVMK
jgi:glycosyltransferase involved in cell wall biosynthesis